MMLILFNKLEESMHWLWQDQILAKQSESAVWFYIKIHGSYPTAKILSALWLANLLLENKCSWSYHRLILRRRNTTFIKPNMWEWCMPLMLTSFEWSRSISTKSVAVLWTENLSWIMREINRPAKNIRTTISGITLWASHQYSIN